MKRVAILRGINVSGHRIIKMADLKQLFQDLGFEHVVTYIQSGNIIFDSSKDQSNTDISGIISKGIFERFGYEVPTIVITGEELEILISKNPYSSISELDPKRLYVTLLAQETEFKNIEKPENCRDQFQMIDQQIYILLEVKYHESKLSNKFFETRLNTAATTRNWKTILKLKEIITTN